MITGINSEDRLVQRTVAEFLHDELGWESVFAWNEETFGSQATFGREDTRDMVLPHDLRHMLAQLNPELPPAALGEAYRLLTRDDPSRSTLQMNREFHAYLRDGVPVTFKDDEGRVHKDKRVRLFDFPRPEVNRFTCVRELKIQGRRSPHYNRRADLVCFVNGLPLVFIELKAVYVNIRAGFDNNLRDYRDTIPHAFHANAFLVVSNGDEARYGSITSDWEHFAEWRRNDESEEGALDT